MKLVLFSKKKADPSTPYIPEWDHLQKEKIVQEVSMNGTICLISESSYQLISGSLSQVDYMSCGLKKEKIELFRSLKFDKKTGRYRPKKLIFKTTDCGALKRSINKFYSNRFTESDPSCLIIIPNEIMELILEDFKPVIAKKTSGKKNWGDDPIRELLQETATDPVVIEVSKVFIGSSYEMQMARLMILKASQSKSAVLILGESGTGKDVVAQQIVKYSSHYKKSFATVNCAALPESLLEGELFGYKKGSFTGADRDKKGLFEAHDGGTLFLDEIGDLSLANQAKLLLAIDAKRIRPIGANTNIPVDVRVIAATNRNIDHMAINGRFREDLLYRLNVLRISAPPLRSHPGDIPDIADYIWKKLCPQRKLTREFHEHLKSYSWPGNVRELKSLLTSITDIFGDISPAPVHIESIRKYRQENLFNITNNPLDDKAQLLKLEAQLRLTNLQNIIRGIKVAMRPVINKELTLDNYSEQAEQIRQHIGWQIGLIENLCREPVYFKEFGLFKETTRYRYLLEKMMKHWPGTPEELQKVWTTELQKLDDDITLGILQMVWGKIDM
ncbi:MAG: sigma 54-interacting transcriptional regulator [Bacteroidales bacterium]|nr:sigma 54-interacting transcriptional regulator [Bacteroidales bacterium]